MGKEAPNNFIPEEITILAINFVPFIYKLFRTFYLVCSSRAGQLSKTRLLVSAKLRDRAFTALIRENKSVKLNVNKNPSNLKQ